MYKEIVTGTTLQGHRWHASPRFLIKHPNEAVEIESVQGTAHSTCFGDLGVLEIVSHNLQIFDCKAESLDYVPLVGPQCLNCTSEIPVLFPKGLNQMHLSVKTFSMEKDKNHPWGSPEQRSLNTSGYSNCMFVTMVDAFGILCLQLGNRPMATQQFHQPVIFKIGRAWHWDMIGSFGIYPKAKNKQRELGELQPSKCVHS